MEAKLIAVVANNLGEPKDGQPISLTTRFREDFDASSLDVLDLVFDVEEAFSILIPDECLTSFVTVGDLLTWLEVHVPKLEA